MNRDIKDTTTWKAGDKVRFKGITFPFWFTDIVENSSRTLSKGTVYTVSSVDVASSWTGITLAETGDITHCAGYFTFVTP